MSKTKYESINRVNCDDKRKRLAEAVLDGAYLHREKGDRKGIRKVKIGGKFNQRVDTYDGRIKAASEILGLNYHPNEIENIYHDMLEKNPYLLKKIKSKDKIKKFISEQGELENIASKTTPNVVSNNKTNRRSYIPKIIKTCIVAGLIGAAILYGPSCEKSKDTKDSQPKSNVQINQITVKNLSDYITQREDPTILEEPTKSLESQVSKSNTQILEPIIIEQKAESPTLNDWNKYVDHVIKRNPQIDKIEGKLNISADPNKFIHQIGKNYEPVLEDFGNVPKDIGFNKKKRESRVKRIGVGLKKAGKGLVKLCTLGFVDPNNETTKKKEGNQLVRLLKSPYDILSGTVEGVIAAADIPTAGIPGKSLDVLTNTFKGTINSAVNSISYPTAVLTKGIGKLENSVFKNDGKISKDTCVGLSIPPRFIGNVFNHEATNSGKTVYISEEELDKGNTGAILEQLGSLGLDYNILKVDKSEESGREILPESEEFDWGTGDSV
ncbi:hypothetical protein KAJ38_01840 [Candidatus Pacearchaeota archaeon]|nr:hypothetical protein [Candidatus Pacearchaeota archaeon]